MNEEQINAKMIAINTDLAIISNEAEQKKSDIRYSGEREIYEVRSIMNQRLMEVEVNARAKKLALLRQLHTLTDQLSKCHE